MRNRIKQYLSKSKVLRSLKYRIFFIILLVGFIPAMILRYGILQNYEQRAVSLRSSDVQTQIKILANNLITYNYLKDTSSEVINAELEQLSNLYDGRVLVVDQNCNVIKDTYGLSEGKTLISEKIMKCFKGENSVNYNRQNRYIELTIPITQSIDKTVATDETGQIEEEAINNMPKVRGVMLASVSTESIAASIDILGNKASILQVLMSILLIVKIGRAHV